MTLLAEERRIVGDADRLRSWVTWQQRPFPDANLLLLAGRQPALVDSGFVGHAEQTADRVRAHTSRLSLVVNTHWHADHVGGNGMLQSTGGGVVGGQDRQLVLCGERASVGPLGYLRVRTCGTSVIHWPRISDPGPSVECGQADRHIGESLPPRPRVTDCRGAGA